MSDDGSVRARGIRDLDTLVLSLEVRNRDGSSSQTERVLWRQGREWINRWGPVDYTQFAAVVRDPEIESDELVVVYMWSSPFAEGGESDPRSGEETFRLAPVVEAKP